MPRRKRGRRERGRRGGGSVYEDRHGQWWAAISLRDRDGRRVRPRVRARDEDDAEAQLERLLLAHRAGVDPAKGTLGQYLRGWLADVATTARPSTHASYEGHVRLHIDPLLGGVALARLRPSDVRRLKARLLTVPTRRRLKDGGISERTLSPSTVGRVLVTLRIALNQAVRDRLLPDNPADAVSLPRVQREPVAPLTEDGAQAILDLVRGSDVEHLVALLLGSGLRAGEALGLDWRDVGDGFVAVRRTKAQVRAVPVSDDAMAALEARRAVTPRYGPMEPVFIQRKRSRITGQRERLRADSARRIFGRLLEGTPYEGMTLHQLRHGVATLLVSSGVHMRVVAAQLGHSNPALTARVYAHVVPEVQREAVDRLNRTRREAG